MHILCILSENRAKSKLVTQFQQEYNIRNKQISHLKKKQVSHLKITGIILKKTGITLKIKQVSQIKNSLIFFAEKERN